jgi:hypothetical protein
MGDITINELKHTLVDSCLTLNSKYGVINNTQLKNCRDNLLGSNTNDDNELLIFGEDRDDKIQQGYTLVNRVLSYLDSAGDGVEGGGLPDLNTSIVNIADKLDKTLLEKYNDKEYSQYNILLDYYNKIEKNRKYDLSKKNEIDTVNKMIIIENNKLEKSSYTLRLIVLIILILVFVILLIVLFYV